ncbi:BTB POZ domain-containing 6-like [Paramuricea clavata]|uniref:BTB POZ domain-containing 6-like n=1 Tax=Paramuricea clavata TaxID=317549 RepID=A0A7D9DT89_PARCT|nr:BTB POZ domain-containing 6-like [Paramuricea clavata]
MARSQQEVDWQSTKKTVLERSRHMFNNSFMSDVAFSCEGSDKKFFAHKYVLGISSAVFYAMFYGKLAEKNSVVHLSDTDDESLQEFLRFLYTDECNLTTHNAMFVLYLTKKYVVPSLAQKCVEFLEANIAVENVSTVLQQALQFNEKKLEKKCLELIDLKTSEAIACDAFTDINEATLAHILKRDSLTVKEVDLFKAVLKWSEAECSRKGIEANAKNKRTAM